MTLKSKSKLGFDDEGGIMSKDSSSIRYHLVHNLLRGLYVFDKTCDTAGEPWSGGERDLGSLL
jgi:hypothetical protein